MSKVIRVPSIVCVSVCFPSIILDQAMNGVKRKRSSRYGELKRYISVTKRSVAYVRCPDIFQKIVMKETIVETRKIFRDIVESVEMFSVDIAKYAIPKSMESVKKYGGLSFLFVSS